MPMAIGKSTDLPKKLINDNYVVILLINETCAHNGSGHILDQVQVRLAKVEPGRVLSLRSSQAAGPGFRPLNTAQPYKS